MIMLATLYGFGYNVGVRRCWKHRIGRLTTSVLGELKMAIRTLRAQYDQFYRYVSDGNHCAYCGDPADTVDHCVPLWFVEGNSDILRDATLVKVPCCFDCNVRAGGKVDWTFTARRRRIALSIRNKTRRILAIADWTEDDINGIGRSLKKSIIAGQEMRRHYMKRLNYLASGPVPSDMPDEFFTAEHRLRMAERRKEIIAANPTDISSGLYRAVKGLDEASVAKARAQVALQDAPGAATGHFDTAMDGDQQEQAA